MPSWVDHGLVAGMRLLHLLMQWKGSQIHLEKCCRNNFNKLHSIECQMFYNCLISLKKFCIKTLFTLNYINQQQWNTFSGKENVS